MMMMIIIIIIIIIINLWIVPCYCGVQLGPLGTAAID
jgi:hypothetical protein